MKQYELRPTDGRKSFYGKAIVTIDEDGTETLSSYNTPIIKRTVSGELVKLWDGWTSTTGRHIKAFCGLNKAQYMSL
jgi:2-hydroxy-3-keto-5-methylthiopentenyl-1-phosphate phosphatase